MMCRNTSGSSAALLLLLLLFMVLVMARADEAPSQSLPPLQPSLSLPGARPTGTWTIFDQLWQTLKDELAESEADLKRLQESLSALQIEVDALQSSLTESNRQLTISEQSRLDERALYDKALQDAREQLRREITRKKLWRGTTAILGGTLGILGLLLVNR